MIYCISNGMVGQTILIDFFSNSVLILHSDNMTNVMKKRAFFMNETGLKFKNSGNAILCP